MTQDDIKRIEILIGYLRATAKGKMPFGRKNLLKVAEEAQKWLDAIKHEKARNQI